MSEQKDQAAGWLLAGGSQPNPAGKPNQDALYYSPQALHAASGRPSALAMVCDGVGGQPGGEEASALAIATLRRALEPRLRHEGLAAGNQQALLEEALAAANEAIFQHNQALGRPPQERMTTTAILAWLHGEGAVVAHVGDSRAYAFTPGQGLARLTTDHTALELDLRRGLVTAEEARAGSYHGGEALTQALGLRESISPDFRAVRLEPGLTLLLCSDGVYKPLGEERLAQTLAAWAGQETGASRRGLAGWLSRLRPARPAPQSPARSAAALGEELLRQVQQAGGQDDATLVIIQIKA